MTNKGRAFLFAGVVIALGATAIWYIRVQPAAASARAASAPRSQAKAKRRILYWAAPMNPSIHSDHPMKDNMGMAYVPVYASAATGQGASAHPGLAIDPRLRQSLGVRLVRVRLRQMGHPIHSVGTVVVDENRVYAINPRFSGWVERLTTRAVGDAVYKGEVL
ncbi:MAG: efflux RND transporter periplasmic adaptor subunit, partial [Acidiferrobacter sp.]